MAHRPSPIRVGARTMRPVLDKLQKVGTTLRKWTGTVVLMAAIAMGCSDLRVVPDTAERKPAAEAGQQDVQVRILVLEATEGVISVDRAPAVPRAEIEFKEIGLRLTTDDEGFALGKVPAGEYTLIVSKPSFEKSVSERGKVSATDWPNVLWISRSKELHLNGKKQ